MKNSQYALWPIPLNLSLLLRSYHLMKLSESWFAGQAHGHVGLLPGLLPLGPPQDLLQLAREAGAPQFPEAEGTGFSSWWCVQVGQGAWLTPGEVGVVYKLCSLDVLNFELLVNEFGLCLCFV